MDASAGSNISDPEAFQFKVNTTDKTLLIRNASNTGWIICGYLDKDYFGITPETIYGVKNNGGVNSIEVVTEQPLTGGSNGNIAIDTTNKKLYQRINGVWTLLLSLSATDLLDYSTLIKNNDGDIGQISIVNSAPSGGNNGDIAVDITNKRMYQKNNDTWNLIFSLRASDLSDYDNLITQEDISTAAEADKIPRADSTGKLPNNIAGSPDKIADKPILSIGLSDGQSLVYRSASDSFVPERVTPGSVINDTEESISSTYSSEKINQLLNLLNSNLGNLENTLLTNMHMLKRNKAYKVGDIAYSPNLPSWARLECVVAGTTGSVEPDFISIENGGGMTNDGTVQWIIDDVRDMTRVGAVTASLYLPSGYVLADGSTKNRSDYPRLINLINKYNLWTDDTVNALGKYGKGDNSTTFVLPNLIDRHIKYTNSAGIKLEAGLPNIKGNANGILAIAKANQNKIGLKGAFAIMINDVTSPIATDSYFQTKTDDTRDFFYIKFDASYSNAIYGASTTVQPPSIQYLPIIRY